ncbi:MAG: hypothetical protein K2X36_04375, partial [Microbacteriaceae bacterium]|nr:hypothetical protein [Microbacteriaceae bacterium]
TGGEGDPDFLLFIRAWVISKVSVPNVASIYAYVVDWLLKGQDPSEDFERPFAYPLFQLQTIIETIRAMRDTTTYLVAQIEARFRGVMTRCLPRDVELFSTICASLDTTKATQYRFPGFGENSASLQWFAQDWDLTIEQEGNDVVVIINNPAEFPLRPHICEAISLKMASFTN